MSYLYINGLNDNNDQGIVEESPTQQYPKTPKIILNSLVQTHPANESLLQAGTEALTSTAVLSNAGNKKEDRVSPETQLHVRTGDNKNFRLYFLATTNIISPYFQNKFCIFLSALTAEQSVTIELGSGIGGNMPNTQLGMMISAIKQAKCNVTTLAAGRCGFTESCLFIFGHKRVISPYGALQFTGIKVYSTILKDYIPYFTYIFSEAKSKNIIKEEHYNLLTTSGKSVMRTYNEFIIP